MTKQGEIVIMNKLKEAIKVVLDNLNNVDDYTLVIDELAAHAVFHDSLSENLQKVVSESLSIALDTIEKEI
jgi:hypothetical protein